MRTAIIASCAAIVIVAVGMALWSSNRVVRRVGWAVAAVVTLGAALSLTLFERMF